MTKFFEVASVSAIHIYHSALELSPLSSIIRRLYYHRRITPSPRVVIGNSDSWKPSVALPHKFRGPHAWSPCSRFIGSSINNYVEVRDTLTSELLSTLRPDKPTHRVMDPLAYSPDGRSICGASDTTIIIWDTQTGGVAKEVECDIDLDDLRSLVWSLDQRTIGAILRGRGIWTVCTYDVASGKKTLGSTFDSKDEPHLWAHGGSFRVMTTHHSDISEVTTFNPQNDYASEPYGGRTINYLEVGPALTLVRTSYVSVGWYDRIKSFSPISHHISVSALRELLILDDRNSVRLWEREDVPGPHCFSSDGNFFAAGLERDIHVWKCGRDLDPGYTPWRKFSADPLGMISTDRFLQFSPTSSSISGNFRDDAQVWHLNGLPTAPVANHEQYTIFSPDGNYIITTNHRESTVTITNLRSQTPPQFIDTGTPILGLALAGNILWVVGLGTIVAWRLAEEGRVDGVPDNRIASRSDSIRSVPSTQATVLPEFSVKGQTGFIALNGTVIYTYHTGSGEEVEDTVTTDPLRRWCSLEYTSRGRYHLNSGALSLWGLGSIKDPSEVWAGDPKVRHRLWLPIEWRIQGNGVKFFHDVGILQLELETGLIIIRF